MEMIYIQRVKMKDELQARIVVYVSRGGAEHAEKNLFGLTTPGFTGFE
jgi:hypothetical protein